MIRWSWLGACAATVGLAAGCIFGGGDEGEEPTPAASASATATETSLPTATATPDRLLTPPATQFDARIWLEAALGTFEPPCPERLKQFGVACAQADGNGDGKPELAYLVPVRVSGAQAPHPAAVFVRDSRSGKLEEFAKELTADASIFGVAFFQFVDRTGDKNAELAYLQNACGSTGCRTQAVLMSWDGTTWRDVGPGDGGTANVDLVKWDGAGAASILKVHGGQLLTTTLAESGPSRAATTLYAFKDTRYAVSEVEADPPEYLYHALLDAEAVFQEDKEASIAVFQRVINDSLLKDWKSRPDQPDRRPSLAGFSYFRIVLAQAALQRDPGVVSAALDRAILESKEPLFVNVALEFRKGYNETGGLIGGCSAVNLYLERRTPEGADASEYVKQLFNYGYANPPGSTWLKQICPF